MSFLLILLALIIDKTSSSLDEWRRHRFFSRWCAWLRQNLPNSTILAVVLVVIVPALIVGVIQHVLTDLLLVLGFLFGLAVLLLSFGDRRFQRTLRSYVDAYDIGDDEIAAERLRELQVLRPETGNPPQLRDLAEATLIEHNENLLAVMFWFVVLGPMGAVIMRLSEQLHRHFTADVEHTALAFAAQRLYGILLWLPTHLALAGFALAGSFTDTWQSWRTTSIYTGEEPERPWWSLAANRALLLIGGLSSVQVSKPAIEWEFIDLKAVLSLTSRSLSVWLVVIALLSLAGIIA